MVPRIRANLRFHSLKPADVEQFENQKPKCSSLLSQPAHKFLHSAFFVCLFLKPRTAFLPFKPELRRGVTF